MHHVAVLALDQVVALDLGIACHVFDSTRLPDGSPAYEVQVCSAGKVPATGGRQSQFTLVSPWRLEDAAGADTIIVPGVTDVDAPQSARVLDLLRDAAARGVRIASVCTGAFVLAASGLLDGRRATTHWEGTEWLARRYPEIDVDPDVLYVDNDGVVLTSAGVAAGLDMCLYMVSCDFGASVAAETARRIVVPLIREGGQTQFIVHKTPTDTGTNLQATLDWMQANLSQPLTLQDVANHAMTSIRSLNRRFREQVGTTPLQWLLALRVERTKQLLESTDLSVERIADEVGFGSSLTLRQHFSRRVGVPPQRYRAAFRARQHLRSVS